MSVSDLLRGELVGLRAAALAVASEEPPAHMDDGEYCMLYVTIGDIRALRRAASAAAPGRARVPWANAN